MEKQRNIVQEEMINLGLFIVPYKHALKFICNVSSVNNSLKMEEKAYADC